MKAHSYYQKAIRLIVSLVIVFSFVPITAQDYNQHALYNYRNDGNFNAWLNFEIDSITYSRIDTLGVEHDDIVVQEVWTPDSLYRIPLEAIDSIGFRAPAPKMRDNLFYIRDYHIGHTLSLDSLTVNFSKAINNDSLPSVGQVMLCVIEKTPFEEGFAGRVQQINRHDNRIEVICSEVSPFDVFERLVIVEMGVSNLDADDGPSKIKRELFDEGIKTIELPEKWKDEYYQNFDLWIDHPDLSYKVSFDWDKISKLGDEYKELKEVWKLLKDADYDAIVKSEQEKDLEEKEWEYKIPIPFELAPVNCVFEFGVMLKPQAANLKAGLEWKTSAFHHIGFNLAARNPLAPNVEGLTDGWDIKYSNTFSQKPCDSFKANVSIDGSFAFGVFARIKASLITKYLLHASVGAEAGIKLSYSGDFTLYDTDCDVPNAYGLLKDTNIGAKLYGKVKGEVGALPFNLINLSEELEYPFWEGKFYLFPHFSEPSIASELGYNQEYNEMFTTTVSKQLIPLLSCEPGLAFYSSGHTSALGNKKWDFQEAAYFDDLPYDFVTPERDVQISAYNVGLVPGETYRCYPVFKMFGREWKAGPYTEFTYPKPLSLEYPSLILQENVPQLVRIEGGWGDYQVSCYPNDAVKAELFTSGNYSQVRITPLKAGTSTVKVLDKRSLETATVEVKVYGNPEDGAAITVSASTLDMGAHSYGERVSQTFTVTNHGSVELCFNVFNSQVNLDNGIVVSDADKLHYLEPGASHTFTVTANGVGPGHYRMGTIYIASNATKDPESILVKVQGKAPKAEYVDLGLSVKWATFNLGALEASDANAGSYISWGENDSKTSYSWDTYKHCDGTAATCHSLGEISGTDNDAARYQWGDEWRLPTVEEMRELKEQCTWTWDETGLYKGYWVTGPNGKSIFLEAAGYADGTDVNYRNHGGVYMTGSQGTNNTDAAYMLGFEQGQYELEEAHRYMGVSIRPVYDEGLQLAEAVDLGLPSGTRWASCNLGATKPEEVGGKYAWGETEEKSEYTEENYLYYGQNLGSNICGTEYDVAHVKWGGNWQMPTKKQIEELISKCTYEGGVINGISGGKFIGPNGNSVFFPAVYFGRGESYWSGTPSDDENHAYVLDVQRGVGTTYNLSRWHGYRVRPVEVSNMIPPAITVVPEDIHFGVVKQGTDITRELTVTNTCNANVTVKMDGCTKYTDCFDVSDNQEEMTLAPGESKVYIVTAHGTKAGYSPTQSLFVNCDGLEEPIEIKMSSYGDDDDPIVDVTELSLNVGETASVKVRNSRDYSSEPDVDDIVELHGEGGSGVSGGPIDRHHPFYNYSESGMTVKALKAGVAHITFTDLHTYHVSVLTITVTENSGPVSNLTCPDDHHPHMIDLGLPSGTKWACCNVDDDHSNQSPTNYGSYYAWGELKGKDYFDWDNYIHCDGSYDTCHDIGSDIAGTEYDVAHYQWGGSWVMPSSYQIQELLDNCSSEWTTLNGVNGRRFTGSNGGTIFLPASGFRAYEDLYAVGYRGRYWSSTLFPSVSYWVYYLDFQSDFVVWDNYIRSCGQSVRPVSK